MSVPVRRSDYVLLDALRDVDHAFCRLHEGGLWVRWLARDPPAVPVLRARAMTRAASARIFTVLAGATLLFQLVLVAGAPWGTLTQGGRFPGVLPASARLLALLSAVLLAGFIHVIRARAVEPPRFRRSAWGVVAYCALGIVANAATPSPAERTLWLPVVVVLFATSLHVARGDGDAEPVTRRPAP